MTETQTLDFYAQIRAALFPIPAGSKAPGGIIESFKHDWSRDPQQWARWRAEHPGCNFGIVAFASGLITVDIDVQALGRDVAWSTWAELCREWGLPDAVMPHVQSARGGWHVYFRLPAGIDPESLRQPDAVKRVINIRTIGYTVAAGSYYDGTARGEESGHYVLLSGDAALPEAPAALIDHCRRVERVSVVRTGTYDPADVAVMLRWLAERDAFVDYHDWIGAGMGLKLEFGDAGFDLWQLTTFEDVPDGLRASKWDSFAIEPTPQTQTLATLFDRAHKVGWRGTVRQTNEALFGDAVAKIAAEAGASLSSLPDPRGTAIPMAVRGEMQTREWASILDTINLARDLPTKPFTTDYPRVPDTIRDHGLYQPLNSAIDKIVAAAEKDGRKWRTVRFESALAILSLVHTETFSALCRKLESFDCHVPENKIKIRAIGFQSSVENKLRPVNDYERDMKTNRPIADNPDNVSVFLGSVGCEIRYNAWFGYEEIKGWIWEEWTRVTDSVVAALRTEAARTTTRFNPSKDFLYDVLDALARQNAFDPAIDELERLQKAWDGQPRLAIWLSRTMGVACDPYHQEVGRIMIGGMVRRIRHPGCKHDLVPVMWGPQGTGKSTVAKLIAPNSDWFSDCIKLGDESKELVQLLAGKCVVELQEMAARGNRGSEHVKAMISTQVDEGRPAYGRKPIARPRRNIFIGTANDEPLSDPTGNRRFLPIHVENAIDLDWVIQNREQLIGEAAHLEAAGATFELPRELYAVAELCQASARAATQADIYIESWFGETPITAQAPFVYVTSHDVVEMFRRCELRINLNMIGASMRSAGFRDERSIIDGKRARIWVKGGDDVRVWNDKELARGWRYMMQVDQYGNVRAIVNAKCL